MILFLTLIVWSLAGLNIFDGTWPQIQSSLVYFGIKSTCFALSSLALRECWHVVLGAQWMLLMRHKVMRLRREQRDKAE